MIAADAAGPRLRLGRVRLVTRLALQPDIAARQTRVAAGDLQQPFGRALSPIMANGDDAVWVIRRVNVRAVGDIGQHPAMDMGELLAGALRDAVEQALRAGGVMRFESRAARLATFLADLAEGDAFDRWYHDRYRALAPLPLPQALRLAIAGAVEDGLPALRHLLAMARLERFIALIGDDGARAVLAVLLPPSPVPPVVGDTTGLAAIAAGAPVLRRWGECPRARLLLLVMASRAAAEPLGALAAAVAAVMPAVVATRLVAGRAGVPLAGVELPDAVMPEGRVPGRRLRGSLAAVTARALPDLAEPIETRFAGVFLLWRCAVELGLIGLLRDGAARLQLAAVLAGPDAAEARADPALHWLAGHVPDADAPPPRPPPALAVARLLVDRAAPRVPVLVMRRAGRLHIVSHAESEDWLTAGSAVHVAGIVAALGLGAAGDAADTARPVDADADHFGARASASAARWAVMARACHTDLARRLPGLARSSATWVARNLVAGAGQLAMGPDGPVVTLPRVPFDLVLRMTGIDGTMVDAGAGRRFRLRMPGAE